MYQQSLREHLHRVNMMLIFAVFCIVAMVSGSIQDNKNSEEIVETCANITQATKEDVEAIINNEIPQSRTSQCFAACWLKELEIMTPDNRVNVANMKEILEELKQEDVDNYNKAMKVIDTCAAEVSAVADECVAAKKFLECRKREDV